MDKHLIEDEERWTQVKIKITADPNTIALLWDQLAYEEVLRGCVDQSTVTEPERMGSIRDLIVTIGNIPIKRIEQAMVVLKKVLHRCLKDKCVIEVTKDGEKVSVRIEIDGYGDEALDKAFLTATNLIKDTQK